MCVLGEGNRGGGPRFYGGVRRWDSFSAYDGCKCSCWLNGNGNYGRTGLRSLDLTLGGLQLEKKAARFSSSAASIISNSSAICDRFLEYRRGASTSASRRDSCEKSETSKRYTSTRSLSVGRTRWLRPDLSPIWSARARAPTAHAFVMPSATCAHGYNGSVGVNISSLKGGLVRRKAQDIHVPCRPGSDSTCRLIQ